MTTKKTKTIKLGECPYCKSENYARVDINWSDDFCSAFCECNDCENSFKEYFALDEVKFDVDGEEFIWNNTLSKSEKETLLKAMQLLIEKENDTENYTRIIRVLKGKLNEE